MPTVDGYSVSSRWTYWLRNSKLHTVIHFSLVFCLHAILHDAVGALYAKVERGTPMCLDVDPVPVFWVTSRDFFTACNRRSLHPLCSICLTADYNDQYFSKIGRDLYVRYFCIRYAPSKTSPN